MAIEFVNDKKCQTIIGQCSDYDIDVIEINRSGTDVVLFGRFSDNQLEQILSKMKETQGEISNK